MGEGTFSVCMVKFLEFYFIFASLVITPVLLILAFIHYSETGIYLWLVLRMFWLPSLWSSDSFYCIEILVLTDLITSSNVQFFIRKALILLAQFKSGLSGLLNAKPPTTTGSL
jgi:hypothetical protein